jgi:hypothetical protein
VNCSAWTANRPAIAYGCAPQVVLEVPQEVKPVPHVAVMAKAPLGAVTNTLVGVGLNALLASQETPTTELPAIVERTRIWECSTLGYAFHLKYRWRHS